MDSKKLIREQVNHFIRHSLPRAAKTAYHHHLMGMPSYVVFSTSTYVWGVTNPIEISGPTFWGVIVPPTPPYTAEQSAAFIWQALKRLGAI